jgi:hypothetical protein
MGENTLSPISHDETNFKTYTIPNINPMGQKNDRSIKIVLNIYCSL